MCRALNLHPHSRCTALIGIEVEVARPRRGSLRLTYVVSGKVSDLRLPTITAPQRADGLWQHTCFEVFVRASAATEYYEFNFAPSTQWAAYRFSGYRDGMTTVREIGTPCIGVQSTPRCYTLQAVLELDGLSALADADWRLSLSAVIEETSGRKSYWALAHPPGEPDFHHSDCFALVLAAASRP